MFTVKTAEGKMDDGDSASPGLVRSTSWQEEALHTPSRPTELSSPRFLGDDAEQPRCWPAFGRWTVLAAAILMQGMGGIMYAEPTASSFCPLARR